MTDILDLIGGKLTDEQVNSLLDILNSEGKNVEINSDGTFETKIGHTYVVESSTDEVLITNANDEPLCELIPAGQVGFVANTTISKTSSLNCTITEVFKYASLIQMGGGGITTIKLPAGYKLLKYLESTGMEVIYITETYGNAGAMAECECTDTTNLASKVNQHVLSFDNVFTPHPRKRSNNLSWWCDDSIEFTPFNTFEKVTVYVNFKNDKKVGVSGIGEQSYTTTFTGQNCNLFNFKQYAAQCGFIGRIYKAAISQGTDVVRDFVPCLDAIGAPCMFDLVSQTAFYNSGTGDFTYPNKQTTATTYSLRNRMYAQLTKHGIRRLYHVPTGYEGTKEEYAAENGFKLLVETPMPEEGYRMPQWHEYEDYIECIWVETAPYIDPALEEEINQSI